MFEQVRERIERVVGEDGFELVDIQFPRFKARQLVRIFIDKKGGVTIDDCRRVSVKVGEVLDIEDPFPMRYALEVSSPGVDRPLKTLQDFRRNVGRTLRLVVSEDGDEEKACTGVLKGVEGETVVVETANGSMEIPLRTIAQAQVCTVF